METPSLALIAPAIFLIALLYSSVGHAGASGYIAVLSLGQFAATVIKPTALVLNVLVACLGSFHFWRAGHFRWSLFWPFAALSVPAAFLGGFVHLPSGVFKPLLGLVLLFSAFRLCCRQTAAEAASPPPRAVALGVGAGIGLLSGLTGTGGGIFLTPLLLLLRWARTKEAAAASALFILVNSVAGLAGYLTSRQPVPSLAWVLAVAAIAGGATGSYLGSTRLPVRAIQLLLAVVLVIAGTKLLLAW